MPDSPRHSVSVAAVITDTHNQVLLIQRRDNLKWEPPGGVLELDESIEDGLRREVYEETGATVTIQRLTGVYKNLPRGIVALVFRCSLITNPALQTAEAMAVMWHDLDTVPDIMNEAYAVRVVDAVGDDRPHIRAHDGRNIVPNQAGDMMEIAPHRRDTWPVKESRNDRRPPQRPAPRHQ